MVNCPRCGTQVPGSFCPSCGAQVAPPGQQQAAAAMVPPPVPQGQQAPPAYPAAPPQPPQQPYGAPAQPPYGAPPQPPQQPYGAPAQQPYGAPAYAPQPARRGGAGKVIGIIVGVVVGLFILLVIIGSLLPDTPGGTVSAPTITDRVDPDTQAPVGSSKTSLPTSTDLIYAAVKVDVKAGQVLSAKWYYEGNHQPQLDTRLPVDADYQGWASFHISNGGEPWPKGSLRVEVLLDGEIAAETTFSIK